MQSKKLKQCALALLAAPLFFTASSASAKLIWQDFSVSYLQGSNYDPQNIGANLDIKTQSEKRDVVTFEHASGHTWGGTFLFIDRLRSRDSGFPNDAMYGEFNINPNLFKPGGFVKNVFAASTIEFGSGDNGAANNDNVSRGNSFTNTLLGVGFGLDVPGASYFNVALYKRFNDQQSLDDRLPVTFPSGTRTENRRERPDNEQITVTWRFDFMNNMFRFDGFMDYATAFSFTNSTGTTTDSETSLNFTPQLKVDLGRMAGMEPKKLWAGIEYVYWQNKFGTDSWDEQNPNLLIKWHF